jgi:putative oxygen-independent coproporphyrinogen III oxidase
MKNLTPCVHAAKSASDVGGAGGRTPRPGVPNARALGVYIHFPWCLRKCPYCDFLSFATDPADVPHRLYADAVLRELESRRANVQPDAQLCTVFFGGGTPSLWDPAELGRVLRGVVSAFPAHCVAPDLEVTVECNPGMLDGARVGDLLEQGVNRLSLGVQALDNDRLAFLGRWHTAAEAIDCLERCVKAGVPNVSADLIFGTAGQMPQAAATEAARLVETGIGHISAYALTIEPRTVFGARARQGQLPLLPEDGVADAFLQVEAELEKAGLWHYEVSNYARPGEEARHNLGYWRGHDYLGLGCGAVGTLSLADNVSTRRRYRNTAKVDSYLRAEAGAHRGPLEVETETLPPEVGLREALMLGLRLTEGVDVDGISARWGTEFWTAERKRAVRRQLERGNLWQDGTRLGIPKSRWLLANSVISALL